MFQPLCLDSRVVPVTAAVSFAQVVVE